MTLLWLTGIGPSRTGKKSFGRTKQASAWATDAARLGFGVVQVKTWIRRSYNGAGKRQQNLCPGAVFSTITKVFAIFGVEKQRKKSGGNAPYLMAGMSYVSQSIARDGKMLGYLYI